MFTLPRTATAPFCPSEVRGSVLISPGASLWRRMMRMQLPFAIWPLIRLTSDRALMGRFANGPWLKSAAWTLFAVISAANLWLLASLTG